MKAFQSIVLAGLFLTVTSHSLSVAREPVIPVVNELRATDSPAVDAAQDLQALGCPGTESCCIAHPTPGCDDPLCCDVVCNRMLFCCEGLWSSACANIAVQVCDVCEPPFVCPQPGECCVGRSFSTGCERSACCQAVCTLDEYCCTGEWDGVCAQKAVAHCLNVCACESFGNFDADPAIDLRDAAAFQNCFSGDGSAPIPPACACADYDGDGDADLMDYQVLSGLIEAQ
ncbi:MAG: hypothetical protein Q7R41_00925 [Phycisphaerales bacterium]|nr:hypothetical protein [Phycisphaerales bacterium]